MATFHVLPPKTVFGDKCAGFLEQWLPGVNWVDVDRATLADMVTAGPAAQPLAYVVFREELPEGIEMGQALKEDFGAEPGDSVIEVAADGSRRWIVA